ncbi:MAG: acetyl-CoA decarbonylase/synthase complex subunit delta [Desulfoarculaceae bacterium]|nr:acetyl-CoA decarbonylase/synthase complex subunit delta [Desulfoarculaceae bacterium]
MKSGSNLERVLRAGEFAVTGELGPPKNGNPEVVREKARLLKGHVDAVNITDCQTAIVRMSSIAAGLITLGEGVEPVIQMTCRDRNRISMQSDILGAQALGLKNLLCLTGDHQKFGNHPGSKGVFDMDSIQMLGMVKTMRDEKQFQCGEEIKGNEPRLFLGAAANPFANPFEYRAVRLGKKVGAGADFIQTQIIYNVERFARFMEMVRDLGLDEKVYILAGVTPPKSLGMARYMKSSVPGMDVPDEVIRRMQDARDKQEEGINICVDIIRQVKEIKGVAGVHVMAIEWESAVPEILKRADLLPRPSIFGEAMADTLAPVAETRESIQVQAVDMEKVLVKARAEAEAIVATARREAEALMVKAQAATPVAAAGDKVVAADTKTTGTTGPTGTIDDAGEHEMNEKERIMALEAMNQGLSALKKAYGLSDEQFAAITSFAGAHAILNREPQKAAVAAAPAAVTAPATKVDTPSAPLAAPAPPVKVDTAAEDAARAVAEAKVKAEAEAKAAAEAAEQAKAQETAQQAAREKAAAEAKIKADVEAKAAAEATKARAEEEAKAKAAAEVTTQVATPAASTDFGVAPLTLEKTTLAERAGKVDEKSYKEKYTGVIRETVLGNGVHTVTVGGAASMPFHLFEGNQPHKALIAMDVLDSRPDDWPETLARHFTDVMDNPVAWAQKCIKEYGAEAINISLVSTDPNGMNRSADDAAKIAAQVIEAVEVPIIVWGCGNNEKDTETLRGLTSVIGNKKVCLAPLEDANYRTVGATAMAFQHSIVAASPIDVNLAKQLNILLQNLGVSLDTVLMDPSIGALGYGIEYSYSVMERIRMAALIQQDEKLQVPFICNLGREVWKAKETKLPTDTMIGDQETRGIMMEALTASCMLMAGGDVLIMRHPKAVAMTKALINGLMS